MTGFALNAGQRLNDIKGVIVIKCPNCGASVKEDQKFCNKCGAKLSTISEEVQAKIDILKKKIEKDSLNADLYMELGNVYRKNNFFKKALSEYQKALNIVKSLYDAHFNCGNIYLKLEKPEKAETSYEKAREIKPKSQEVMVGLFWTYYKEEKYDDAIRIVKDIESESIELDMHKALKDMYLKKEIMEKAFAEMKIISRLEPENKENLKEIADYFRSKEEDEKAFEYYQKVLKVAPEDIEACYYVGEYYCKKGNYQKTIEHLRDIVERLSPKKQNYARIYLGHAYVNQGETDRAISEITHATLPDYKEFTPSQKKLFAETYYMIGEKVSKRDNYPAAIKYINKATSIEPQNLKYKERLEELQKEHKKATAKEKRKIKTVAIATASIMVVAALGWWLTHGKILTKINPPKTANIYIDGESKVKNLGDGQYITASLFWGTHKIIVKKNGYEEWSKDIKVGLGRTKKVEAILVPIYGALKVNSIPSGAEVLLDDKIIGETPLSTKKILSTDHNLELKLKGYKSYDTNITIPKNNVFDLNVTLKGFEGIWKGKLYNDYAHLQLKRGGEWRSPSVMSGGYDQPFSLKIKQFGERLEIEFILEDWANWLDRYIETRRKYTIKIDGRSFSTNFVPENVRKKPLPNGGFLMVWGKKIEATLSKSWDLMEGYIYESSDKRVKFKAKQQK